MIEETVGKYHVEYNEENHSYYVNGQKAISVTTLIKWANPLKYSGIDEEILKKAAEYGTKVHEAIENYETIGMADKEVEELSDYLFLKKHYKWEVKECEKIIVIPYKDIYIAGRLDMIMELNGTIGIVDIKTTSELDKEYLSLQLNLYRLGYQECYGKQIDFLGYLWLRAKNKNYKKRSFCTLWINETYINKLLEEYYMSLFDTEEKIENKESENN